MIRFRSATPNGATIHPTNRHPDLTAYRAVPSATLISLRVSRCFHEDTPVLVFQDNVSSELKTQNPSDTIMRQLVCCHSPCAKLAFRFILRKQCRYETKFNMSESTTVLMCAKSIYVLSFTGYAAYKKATAQSLESIP